MCLGFFLVVVAVVVLASLQYRADRNRLNKGYEDWKNDQR
jgi:hypothetical protein